MSEFPQIRKLKSKTLIDRVFKKGEQIQFGHLAIHYLKKKKEEKAIFMSVSVSKKGVSLAVNRNRIKRKIRASIIIHKELVKRKLVSGYYMILYMEKKNGPLLSISENLVELIEKFK